MKKPRFKILLLSSIVYCLLSVISCNQKQNSNQPPQVGEFDSSAIARDTLMQMGIESSYEYSKTLAISDTLVYDIRAYGGPATSGEFAILRRGSDNKADTVVKSRRNGIIANSFISDLNKNGMEEIYIVTQSPGSNSSTNVSCCEIERSGNAHTIQFENIAGKKEFYRGRDTVYVYSNFENELFLCTQFPAYKKEDADCCPTAGQIKIFYRLFNHEYKLVPRGLEAPDSTKKFTGIKVQTSNIKL